MDITKFLTQDEEANDLFKKLTPKEVFTLLEHSKNEELISLKKILNPEILHHQFLKLFHFLEEVLENKTDELIRKNESLPPATLNKLKLEESSLMETALLLQKIQLVLEVSLSLCFRGGYIELIDKLQTLKSYTTKTERNLLNPLINRTNEAKGLVFGKTEKDDDPAIDGLTAFGCWNLEHFRELKLLPLEKPIEEQFLSEEEKDQLFESVKKSLRHLKLDTIGDLKKHEIYSKEDLVSYIKRSLKTL